MAAVGDVYEVTFYSVNAEQCAINRLFYRVGAFAGTGATNAQIAAVMAAQIAVPLKAVMSASATYRGLRVSQVWPRPRSIEAENTTNQGVGGVAGNILPRQVRGIITKRTNYAGPQFRGRFYTPFPSAGSNDTDGTPLAAFVTSLTTLASAILANQVGVGAGGNTVDLNPILWHPVYVNGQVTSQSHDVITSTRANDKWATQRKSGTYGSPNVAPM